MSTEENLPSNWKKPDELIKLHRLKQKKKQLTARLNQNANGQQFKDINKAELLEAKIAQKRKNPFAKTSAVSKKLKPDDPALHLEDSLLDFVNAVPIKEKFCRETPTKPEAAKFVLKPFDAESFAKLLQKTLPDNDEADLQKQKFTKHLPMDWSLKARLRFFSPTELPSTTLKSNQMASGLTSFVRCIDSLSSCSGLDISPATRFNQSTFYWQHPHMPWMKLFPRNAKENTGITIGDRERKALTEDWDLSFRGLFQLLRARQCPYFYLCANTFTVLFRAAGIGGHVEIHALMSPTTRGIRNSLRQEGVEYIMPLKKDAGVLNKSNDNSFTEDDTTTKVDNDQQLDDDDEDDDDWLESLGVDDKEIRRIQSAHARKIKAQEMSEDFSDNSLILIEGVECQGFFSFLLNAKSSISNVGRLAGVPPTLLSPVAFPKATMQHLNVRSNKVRLEGVDYFSIEMKGIIMPSVLPYICQLFGEAKGTFSATMAASNVTLAFSKATKKILEQSKTINEVQETEDDAVGEVFGKENLSDCGLLPSVVESLCRTGKDAVNLLERICFSKEYGYAWS